ncbi:hypothetical protein FACS1894103_1660 [Campylobacterota bacterium]|nr:hypothetical protein FACS1894103_1660 [Campylobacterota bacterium]
MTHKEVIAELSAEFNGRKFIRKAELAMYLNTSEGTLNRFIQQGAGIPYTKRGTGSRGGRILYHINDIADYVIASRVKTV